MGLIQDRTAVHEPTVGSCFQLGPDIFVSVASILEPYRANPQALKIAHSAGRAEYFVEAISFHPDFKSGVSSTVIDWRAKSNPLVAHNCCFLHVGSAARKISTRALNSLSASLRRPLDLNKAEFRGALAKIDMALIVQTLNTARSDGILYLCDSLMRPIAQVYCMKGRIVGASYENLVNEIAMYQIIQKGFPSTFAFLPMPDLGSRTNSVLNLPVDALLLEAHRRVDELAPLRDLFPDGSTFKAALGATNANKLAAIGPSASTILKHLDPFVGIEELWHLSGCDDYTIYKTISDLVSNNLVEIISSTVQANSERVHEFPNADCAQIELSNSMGPGREISNICMLPGSKKLVERKGEIISTQPDENAMMLHNILLLPESVGSPLVQDGKIVGLHCGGTMSSGEVVSEIGNAFLPMQVILGLRKEMQSVLQENQKRIAQGWTEEEDESTVDSTVEILDSSGVERKGPRKKAAKGPVKRLVSLVIWFVLGYALMVSASRAMEYFAAQGQRESSATQGSK